MLDKSDSVEQRPLSGIQQTRFIYPWIIVQHLSKKKKIIHWPYQQSQLELEFKCQEVMFGPACLPYFL